MVKQNHAICVSSCSISARNCCRTCCPEAVQRGENCTISVVCASNDSGSRWCVRQWLAIRRTHRTGTVMRIMMSEPAPDKIKQRSLLIGDECSIKIKSDQVNISLGSPRMRIDERTHGRLAASPPDSCTKNDAHPVRCNPCLRGRCWGSTAHGKGTTRSMKV